jgi:3D (Asp-Asp-Asp) domain-containing protein
VLTPRVPTWLIICAIFVVIFIVCGRVDAATRRAHPRVMRMSATAYCLKGRTSNGDRVRRGMVAADPRLIPPGTVLRVVGSRASGIYTVSDRGGSIKGRELDIFMPNCRAARQFGRRPVRVRVIERVGATARR